MTRPRPDIRALRQLAERGGIYDGNQAVLDLIDYVDELEHKVISAAATIDQLSAAQ